MHADDSAIAMQLANELVVVLWLCVASMLFLSLVYCIDQMFSKVLTIQVCIWRERTVLRIGETTSVVRTPIADKTHGSDENI